MSVEARLLNVFNNQTQLSTDAQQFLDLRTTTGAARTLRRISSPIRSSRSATASRRRAGCTSRPSSVSSHGRDAEPADCNPGSAVVKDNGQVGFCCLQLGIEPDSRPS